MTRRLGLDGCVLVQAATLANIFYFKKKTLPNIFLLLVSWLYLVLCNLSHVVASAP